MNSDTNDAAFTHTLEAAGSCLKCHYVLPRLVDCAPDYFEHGSVLCGHCGEQVNLWKAALDGATRMSIAPAWALANLGAGKTNLIIPMESGQHKQIDLCEHGVPANAKILARNYTGQTGDITAVEWHGNSPSLRFPGTILVLWEFLSARVLCRELVELLSLWWGFEETNRTLGPICPISQPHSRLPRRVNTCLRSFSRNQR